MFFHFHPLVTSSSTDYSFEPEKNQYIFISILLIELGQFCEVKL